MHLLLLLLAVVLPSGLYGYGPPSTLSQMLQSAKINFKVDSWEEAIEAAGQLKVIKNDTQGRIVHRKRKQSGRGSFIIEDHDGRLDGWFKYGKEKGELLPILTASIPFPTDCTDTDTVYWLRVAMPTIKRQVLFYPLKLQDLSGASTKKEFNRSRSRSSSYSIAEKKRREAEGEAGSSTDEYGDVAESKRLEAEDGGQGEAESSAGANVTPDAENIVAAGNRAGSRSSSRNSSRSRPVSLSSSHSREGSLSRADSHGRADSRSRADSLSPKFYVLKSDKYINSHVRFFRFLGTHAGKKERERYVSYQYCVWAVVGGPACMDMNDTHRWICKNDHRFIC
eukprot:Lankesteria_metandrocarpae@DN4255_c0_g1_i1.p1